MSNIAIKVTNVSKSFKLPHEKHTSIKSMFVTLFRGSRTYESQQVLRDISIEVKKGEFLGVVGRNGSGKSTLLKLLSGIYSPDEGSIEVNGKLVPFIELGVGFNPDLTGRENVYLNGALLGFSRKEMDAMYDEIVEFAELEKFMDQKLKNYSSGMQVRLAFSIAVRANTEILVLDEVLAVGDEAFQKKCYYYFTKLKRDKKTVILVTHSMDSVQQFCTRAIMIDKGRVVSNGNPAKVAQKYRELFMSESVSSKQDKIVKNKQTNQSVNMLAKIEKQGESIKIYAELTAKEEIRDSILSLFIDRDTGEQVYRFSSDEKTGNAMNLKKNEKIVINIEIQNIFPNGVFTLRASLKSRDRTNEYASFSELDSFEIDRRLGGKSEWDIHWQPNEKFSVE